MLVAAVASKQMSAEDNSKLHDLLSLWRRGYPGMSWLESAAVWADHVKCSQPAPWCSGLPHFDRIELFNAWHYVSLTYNPEEIHLSPLYEMAPWPETGAIWATRSMWSSLTGKPPIEHKHDHSEIWERPNRHDLSTSQGLTHHRHHDQHHDHTHNNSTLSWNLQLRLLIHIIGDIHQPLHSCEAFSKKYPQGDEGGNKIHIHTDSFKGTLHFLWDSAAGLFENSWPTESKHDVDKVADTLISKYPPSFFGDRLKGEYDGMDFERIAHDSHKICRDIVYKEIDFSQHDAHYIPSSDYLNHVKVTAAQQVTLGGYRLAHILTSLISHLPPLTEFGDLTEVRDTKKVSELGSKERTDTPLTHLSASVLGWIMESGEGRGKLSEVAVIDPLEGELYSPNSSSNLTQLTSLPLSHYIIGLLICVILFQYFYLRKIKSKISLIHPLASVSLLA
eukprot:GHVN01094232.1.p1 GENE.GHVN01094232.1~~GHVN01094232.1.p1  ORF type:complete len:447 (+),score=87.71 GHVN01094232.1:465-1805(+)